MLLALFGTSRTASCPTVQSAVTMFWYLNLTLMSLTLYKSSCPTPYLSVMHLVIFLGYRLNSAQTFNLVSLPLPQLNLMSMLLGQHCGRYFPMERLRLRNMI